MFSILLHSVKENKSEFAHHQASVPKQRFLMKCPLYKFDYNSSKFN
jgi:hypothetical protein